MENLKDAAAQFLSNKRVAGTGVSRTPAGHGSNVVYQRLRDRGNEEFAVNPGADEVEGAVWYRELKSVPRGIGGVVIGTPPGTAGITMHACAELGAKHGRM